MNRILSLAWLFMLLPYFTGIVRAQTAPRIVSLDGTVSEILYELGLESRLVGVDVTSTYPESLQKLPQVGHNRNIGAEGVLAQRPTLVLTTEKAGVKSPVLDQIRHAGAEVISYRQEFSAAGARQLIRDVANTCRVSAKGEALIRRLDADLAQVKKVAGQPKVLFIYARGAGTLFVAGRGTPVETMIELAGGRNAATGFADFKPLTAEALVAADPDVILLFDSGLESLSGPAGLLGIPGIAQTRAGKEKRFIAMEGHLLTGFTPRLGKAISELARKIGAKERSF